MKSYAKWILIAFFMCALVSFVDKDKPTKGLNVGDSAPNFEIKILSEQDSTIDLTELKGRYVLLSFWASYDAQSRMQNVSLSNALRLEDSKIKMVSVSFDQYKSIFDETIKKDQIVTPSCFVETKGEKSKLYDRYSLKSGFSNYLLDENGIIIAKNISADELSAYLQELG